MASFMTRAKEWYATQPVLVKAVVVAGGGAVGAVVGIAAAPFIGAAASAAGLGVAAGTLSGAAATSAGLAAIGGGSLAAGGLGVAGGTVLVGAAVGAAGTAVAARGGNKLHQAGEASIETRKTAESTEVGDDEIRFDGEG